MPAAMVKSNLMKRYAGAAKAVQAKAEMPFDPGRIELPPGITHGIAKLARCYFDKVSEGKKNAGEYYFRAVGVVAEPKFHVWQGVEIKTEGLQTTVFEMCCRTENQKKEVTTSEDHFANITNILQGLGATAETFEACGYDLEQVAAMLEKAKPLFRFSTQPKTDQNDKTLVVGAWERWHGSEGLEDYDPTAGGDDTVDHTQPAPAATAPARPTEAAKTLNRLGVGVKAPPATTNGAKASTAPAKTAPGKKPPVKAPPPPPEPEFDESVDIDSLAARAMGQDEEAQKALTEMAEGLGISDAEINEADDWEAVADLVRGKQGGGDDEGMPPEEPEGEQVEIKVEDVYLYAPLDPKTNKPGKPIECEVLSVNSDNGTVTLKNYQTGKTIQDAKKKPLAVPFSELKVLS